MIYTIVIVFLFVCVVLLATELAFLIARVDHLKGTIVGLTKRVLELEGKTIVIRGRKHDIMEFDPTAIYGGHHMNIPTTHE